MFNKEEADFGLENPDCLSYFQGFPGLLGPEFGLPLWPLLLLPLDFPLFGCGLKNFWAFSSDGANLAYLVFVGWGNRPNIK